MIIMRIVECKLDEKRIGIQIVKTRLESRDLEIKILTQARNYIDYAIDCLEFFNPTTT